MKTPPHVPVEMPRLGEAAGEGTVTRWLKDVGEEVAVDEPLLEISTDKVDTEIPSPTSGVLTEILVQENETVDAGTELAVIEAAPVPTDASGQGEPEATSALPSAPASEPGTEDGDGAAGAPSNGPRKTARRSAASSSGAATPPQEQLDADTPRGTQPRKPSTPAGKVKVSFNLWPEEVERLRRLATAARTTVTAALQRAIADETFLADEIGKGALVLLKYPNGTYREVIMRR